MKKDNILKTIMHYGLLFVLITLMVMIRTAYGETLIDMLPKAVVMGMAWRILCEILDI